MRIMKPRNLGSSTDRPPVNGVYVFDRHPVFATVNIQFYITNKLPSGITRELVCILM